MESFVEGDVALAHAGAEPAPPPTFTVGGITVNGVTMETALDHFFSMGRRAQSGYVCVVSSHGVVDSQKDQQLAGIMNDAVFAIPDGMPLAFVGRQRLGREAVSRVPGPEFMELALSDDRAVSERHFFYGGTPDVLEKIVARATAALGAGAIAGSYSPPFRDAGVLENDDVIEMIRETRPSIVWVGISTPKQEHWMSNHSHEFPGARCIGVGAAFDFYAEVKQRGPEIVQKSGFEWLYRLLTEPARLWPRYRYVVPKMLAIVFKETYTGQADPRVVK
jgi:N-acetylglucosaminyldiphosphoundecaprenol N-acetyl-beta-D-mannosaminyltransferase